MHSKTPKDYPMSHSEKTIYIQTVVATFVLAVVIGYLIGKWIFS